LKVKFQAKWQEKLNTLQNMWMQKKQELSMVHEAKFEAR